ncbi:Calcium-transporting ATPase 9, plasma membrane-type, partial [Cucurbita argyrosperma subsp. argyrosperma]
MTSRGSSASGNGLFPLNASTSGRQDDVEAGLSSGKSINKEEEEEVSDPFDVDNTKNVPLEILKRWRQAALVLNASRRFRYTLDLKKEEEKEKRRRMIRAHSQVIRAALLFKLAGEQQTGIISLKISICLTKLGIFFSIFCVVLQQIFYAVLYQAFSLFSSLKILYHNTCYLKL